MTTRFAESTTTEVDGSTRDARMAAESLAALSPDDRLEVESPSAPRCWYIQVAAGQTIAVASLTIVDGTLIATIIHMLSTA